MIRYWAIRFVCIALMLGVAPVCLAAGSWVANASSVNVAVPGRVTSSEALSAANPSRLIGRQVSEVSWRFRLPPDRALQAWLCQGVDCLSLTTSRGRRTAPMSWQAGGELYFRFLLPNGQRRAVRVEGLQVIVNYRSRGASTDK